MIVYKNSEELNESFLHEVLKLDARVYPEELQGTFERFNARFQKNKQNCLLAFDGTKIVGYLCYLNISSQLKDRIIKILFMMMI